MRHSQPGEGLACTARHGLAEPNYRALSRVCQPQVSLPVDSRELSLWLDTFYYPNITPLFFMETLADLEKQVAEGRTPEQVVGNLAEKTPVQSGGPNVHHTPLYVASLLGQDVAMDNRVLLADLAVLFRPGRFDRRGNRLSEAARGRSLREGLSTGPRVRLAVP